MRTTHAAAPPGHQPVLLTETITLLQPRPGGRYLDGTFGGGGHTRAILAGSAPDGRVLALDADPAAISRGEALRTELADPDRLRLVHANFADLARIASEAGFAPLDGILLDLGLSSFQLDEADRGFAFRYEGPLDMRFDPTQGNPAADLVNELPQDALADLIYRYGEEPRSRRIAAAIVRARREAPILTTTRLAEIVSHAVGGRRGRDIHPATQTFQALRIAVNGELEALEQALTAALTVLAPGGRLVVISFHSLEDRIVKRFFQRERSGCICPPEQPVCTCGHQPRLRLLTRTVRASAAEQANNPRSRSATLRAAERLAEEPTGRGDRGSDITGARIGSAWDSSPRLSDGSRLKPTGDPAFRESATAAGRVPRKDMSFRAAAGVPLGHLSFPLATGAKDHSCEHEVRPCHQRSWVSASTRSRTASPLRNERWPRGTPAAARNDRERVRQNTDRRSWRSRGPAAPGDSSGSTLRTTEGRVQDDKSGRSNIERSGQETISVGFSRLISLSLGLESQVEQATTTHRDIKHSRAETTPNTISISARSYNGVRNYHEGSIHGRGGANR